MITGSTCKRKSKMNLFISWETTTFLGFITDHRKTADDIKKMILDRLEKEKLDRDMISQCG